MESVKTNIRKSISTSPITLDKDLYVSTNQKAGSVTAQLRQSIEVTSFYPKAVMNNSLIDGMYSATDFGTEETPHTHTENRIAWYNIPTTVSKEQFLADLAKCPSACIYRIMSNHPILSDEQKHAVEEGITSYDVIAKRQLVCFGKMRLALDGETGDANGLVPNPKAGQPITDRNGKAQYKVHYFSAIGKEDVDLRTADSKDQYIIGGVTGHVETEEINSDDMAFPEHKMEAPTAQQA